MSVQLNHTIVWCRDQRRSSKFLTEILGLPDPVPFGPFQVVHLANGASLDYYDDYDTERGLVVLHYAFLVSEEEFDQIYGRIRERRIEHWADPARTQAGAINRHDGGRGVYFADPDNHLLEIITRPYGSGANPAGAA